MSIQAEGAGVSPRTWAILVWSFYLASFLIFFLPALVGVIIAHVKRADLAGTPYESHMTSAIWTFWIGLAVGVAGIVLISAVIGAVILLVLTVWLLFRDIRGLIRALDGKPVENPTGWL